MEKKLLDRQNGNKFLAQSAIDIALWDALGKQVNMPYIEYGDIVTTYSSIR